jgi:hypothetical protein
MLVRLIDNTPFACHLIPNWNHITDNYAVPSQVFGQEKRRTFSSFFVHDGRPIKGEPMRFDAR